MQPLSRTVGLFLAGGVAAIMAVFALTYTIHKATARVPADLLNVLHINTESSIPAWFNSGLLLLAALLAVVLMATAPRKERVGWLVIALILGYLSADEAAGLHELLGRVAERASLSVGTFAWVIPGAILGLTLFGGLILAGRRLPAPTRRPLLVALLAYGAAALGVEMVTGFLITTLFPNSYFVVNVLQPILVMIEESVEMLACVLVIVVFIRQLEADPHRREALASLLHGRAEQPSR